MATKTMNDTVLEYAQKGVCFDDNVRLDGPMSYDYWSPITPEQLAEVKRHNREHAKKREEKIKKEIRDE